MSWWDDTRCLYCQGKMPWYRKIINRRFCSTRHQKTYWNEQERLAVEVLHRTHDALMAFRPAQDVELIIGPAVGWNGQSLDVAPAQEPVRPEPVGPRVERTCQPAAQPVADAVYERARPMAQPNPPAQSPSTPDPVRKLEAVASGDASGFPAQSTALSADWMRPLALFPI